MNVEEDTKRHIERVRSLLCWCASELEVRADLHDASKLRSPEREMYEVWRPKLDSMNINSPEYQEALKQMGEGLTHHYQENRHHPEHFSEGLAGMTLVDVLEMVCDWKAAAERKGQAVDMEWASRRFGFEAELYCIIENTVEMLAAVDGASGGGPVGDESGKA
jgi:hypothetical protein